jgi:hypothetical protein
MNKFARFYQLHLSCFPVFSLVFFRFNFNHVIYYFKDYFCLLVDFDLYVCVLMTIEYDTVYYRAISGCQKSRSNFED